MNLSFTITTLVNKAISYNQLDALHKTTYLKQRPSRKQSGAIRQSDSSTFCI